MGPNLVGDGQLTLNFFKQVFDFNGRETVAILGAHTLGRMHVYISLFRYVWTGKSEHSFNNDYYK